MGPELVDDLRKMRIAICQRECHVVMEEECRLEYMKGGIWETFPQR